MPEPETSAHFLVLGPLPASAPEGGGPHAAVLADLAKLHEAGHRLDGIIVLGTSGDPAEAKDLVTEVQLTCLERGDDPFVTSVPGPADRRTMPAKRSLARDLAGNWDQVASDLWRGEMTEDIVQPLRTQVFPELVAWDEDSASSRTGWHPGLLPGDGSLHHAVGERTVGLVCVNTVFRMVADDAAPALAGCFEEQLDHAVDGTFADWAGRNDLTLLLAGRTGTLPELPGAAAPLLALAGSGERDSRGWHLPFGETAPAHLLLRADLGADRPVVVDIATGRQLPTTVRVRTSTVPPGVPTARRPEEPYDEGPLLNDFYRHLSTGQMVLALVSGPDEDGAVDSDEFNRRLAEAAFGAMPRSEPALHETWAAARRRLTPEQLEQHLKTLSVPPGHDEHTVFGLLRAPWSRLYDFTGSDAVSVVRDARLADTVSLVDACQEPPTVKRGALEVIAMHGRPQGGVPQDFGDAWSVPPTDARSLWFRRFRAELLTRPVLFLALSPSSPALWETLRMAGRASGEREFPGFLVTPDGTGADRARLREAGLRHIRTTPAEFVRDRLRAGNQALTDGRRVLTEEYAGTRDGVGIVRVSKLVDEAPAGTWEFLLGRDPTWGDIKDKNIVAQLALADVIEERAQSVEGERQQMILVNGTAGSGKTTALMQVAYRLQKKGMNVGWVDRGASLSPREIEQQARSQHFDAIFLDDVDMFTRRATSLMKSLSDDARTLVVAAIRVTARSEIDADFPAEGVDADRLLSDKDLKKIIKVLDKSPVIGDFNQPRFLHQRVAKLRERCDQGLLAAMIEAVSGESLKEKVASEFQALKQPERVPYAVVSFSDSSLVFQQRGIDAADLVEIVSHPDPPGRSHWDAVNELVDMKLLVRTADGRLRCRQRTIADTLVQTVLRHRKDDLELVIAKLLLFYAGRSWHITDNQHRDRSAMIKLLNHNTLRDLGLTVEAVRRIYDGAHTFLSRDHHYWLQRAEYEAEQGRLDLATNHLAAAKGCPDGADDRLVVTADAKVRLRRSMQVPADRTLIRAAVRAVRDLSQVATTYKKAAPHAFVVLARDGCRWLERCGEELTPQEHVDAVGLIRDGIALGRKCLPTNNQVGRAMDEYGPKAEKLGEQGPGLMV